MIKLEAANWSVRGNLMVSFYMPGSIAIDTWQNYCDTIASEQVHKVLATSIGAVEVTSTQRKQVSRNQSSIQGSLASASCLYSRGSRS